MVPPLRPLLTHPADRPAVWLAGDRLTVMLSAAETGGAFSLFDCEVGPDCGAPPHTHQREEETFRILDGEVEFHIGAETVIARPGDVVFGPRGVPHWFHNRTATMARMLVLATPGGLEGFFLAAGVPVTGPVAPAPSEANYPSLLRTAADFGIVIAAQDRDAR